VRLGLLIFALLIAGHCAAQDQAPLTRAQGDAILKELADIKRALADLKSKPAGETESGAPSKVKLGDVAVDAIGSPDAPVTMVEFTDYQCPFCKRFHERSWPEIKKKYVDTGKVRFVVRDMPLSFHEQALPAAIAARCAGQQGRFPFVFEALFALPELSNEAIRAVVSAAGVAEGPYRLCTATPVVRAAITADSDEAERLGINGTPGFVIAQKKGDALEGALIVGAQPTNVFTSRLDALLAAPPATAPAPAH